MACNFPNQIENRNFLSPIGFKFTLANYPKISFFSNATRIPEINMGTAIQPSYLKDLDVPGDKMTYGDFTLRFVVDETLENYMAVHNWLTGLGYPESTQDYRDLITNDKGIIDPKEAFSDGSLHILNINFQDTAIVKFRDLFPVFLTSLEFEATEADTTYFTAEVTFKYTVYNILKPDGRTPL